MTERHSAEKTKGRKKNDQTTNSGHTQKRADIWAKRRLTEKCIYANKHQNGITKANKQLIVWILHR